MKINSRTPAIVFLATVSCGCANFNSIFHTFEASDGKSVSIDAKQRVVLADSKRGIVCAEPSPDALSALSASLNASVITPERLTAQLAASNAESATSIGLRTQTIQLLRDAMYRVCEGYMSGALTGPDFLKVHRRYQNLMLGLLAVEQLTGTVTPHPVVLHSGSNAGDARGLLQAQEAVNDGSNKLAAIRKDLSSNRARLDEAKKSYSKIEKDIAGFEALAKSDPTKQPDLDKTRSELDTQKIQVKEAEGLIVGLEKQESDLAENVKSLEGLRDAARSANSHATAGGTVQLTGNSSHPMNKDTAKIISDAVEVIVKTIVTSDFSRETCLDYLVSAKNASNTSPKYQEESDATRFCKNLLIESITPNIISR